MAAYWVTTYTAVRDPSRLAAYAALAGPAIAAGGGRFLARGEPAHVLEGTPPVLRAIVIEFPSTDAAHGTYRSQEYQQALRELGDAVDREVCIVEAAPA